MNPQSVARSLYGAMSTISSRMKLIGDLKQLTDLRKRIGDVHDLKPRKWEERCHWHNWHLKLENTAIL